jgi:hypothetical protein
MGGNERFDGESTKRFFLVKGLNKRCDQARFQGAAETRTVSKSKF